MSDAFHYLIKARYPIEPLSIHGNSRKMEGKQRKRHTASLPARETAGARWLERDRGSGGSGWRRGSRKDASLVCGISMKSARGRARVENFGWRVLFALPRCADNCWRLLTVKVPNAVALPTRLHRRELVKPGDLAGRGRRVGPCARYSD